ncbi:MAG: ABC transporter substrate-binding protein [Spirochaetota bacterium]
MKKNTVYRSLRLTVVFTALLLTAAAAVADAEIEYARGFSAVRRENYTIVRVRPSREAGEAPAGEVYVLVPEDAEIPNGFENALIIRTPAERVTVFAGVPLSPFVLLNEAGSLAGVGRYREVTPPGIRERIEEGRIKEFMPGGKPDLAGLLDLSPTLVLISPETDKDIRRRLLELNFPVVIHRGGEEPDPLGRAEWIKFTALFLDRARAAEELFDYIEAEYLRLRDTAQRAAPAEAAERVLVAAGTPGPEYWEAPGGGSRTARLIADAGGRYLWADRKGAETVRLPMETALEEAKDADVWILPDTGWNTFSDAAAADERTAELKPFLTGRIYTGTKRLTAAGGNDAGDTGIAVPSLLLADIIRILYPKTLPEEELTFYKRLKWE